MPRGGCTWVAMASILSHVVRADRRRRVQDGRVRRVLLDDRSVPVVALRVSILLLGVLAEAWNIVDVVRSGERWSEHFAYFTVQANLLVLAVVAWTLAVPAHRRPAWSEHVRGAATAYAVLAGLVWAVLLAEPGEALSWTIEYTNVAQHRLVPALLLLDWLLVAGPRIRLVRCLWWMAYPVGYLASAWLRGGLVDGWFPYPFLDPGEHGGWAGLVGPVGQVLLAFLVGIAAVALGGALRRRLLPLEGAQPASLASRPSSTSASPHSNSSP